MGIHILLPWPCRVWRAGSAAWCRHPGVVGIWTSLPSPPPVGTQCMHANFCSRELTKRHVTQKNKSTHKQRPCAWRTPHVWPRVPLLPRGASLALPVLSSHPLALHRARARRARLARAARDTSGAHAVRMVLSADGEAAPRCCVLLVLIAAAVLVLSFSWCTTRCSPKRMGCEARRAVKGGGVVVAEAGLGRRLARGLARAHRL